MLICGKVLGQLDAQIHLRTMDQDYQNTLTAFARAENLNERLLFDLDRVRNPLWETTDDEFLKAHRTSLLLFGAISKKILMTPGWPWGTIPVGSTLWALP